jgi:deoxyribonucleoside regulator
VWSDGFDVDAFEEYKLMMRCVDLYYGQDQPQNKIAAELKLTISKVSRLIQQAKRRGYIQISYRFPDCVDLASRLIDRFGLRDALVIPVERELSADETKVRLGVAAAAYFEKHAMDNMRVGLSCGLTLYHMVNSLRPGLYRDLKLYPLATEVTPQFVDINPNTLVGMMAAKYRPNVEAYSLHATVETDTPSGSEVRQRLIGRMAEVFKQANDVDIALISIGEIYSRDGANSPEPPNVPGFNALLTYLGVAEELLRESGAVGEINYQLFDDTGRQVSLREEISNLTDRAVSLSRLRELCRGRKVIAIAGGQRKLGAIRGALRGGFFNILVTTDLVATQLLRTSPNGGASPVV